MGEPLSLFALASVDFDDAWICTAHPNDEPLTVNSGTGLGGCVGGLADTGYPKHIVSNGVTEPTGPDTVEGDVVLFGDGGVIGTNTIRFSFPVEFTVDRTNLYVHVKASVDLTPDEAARRRRLLQTDTTTSTAHFAGAVGINDEVQVDDTGDDDGDWTGDYSVYELIGIAVAVTSAVCLLHFILFGMCYRKKSQQRKEMELNLQKSVESQSTSKAAEVVMA